VDATAADATAAGATAMGGNVVDGAAANATAARRGSTASAPGRRRIGIVGIVGIVGLAAATVVVMVSLANRAAPARQCRGAGTHGPVAAQPEEAIASFAGDGASVPWLRRGVEIPPDRWIRRSDSLWERTVDDDTLLQLDVSASDEGWTVSGLWVCRPLDTTPG
jgi:hypothetical protein